MRGGQNETHATLERFYCLDSFDIGRAWVDLGKGEFIRNGVTIPLDFVPCGYGYRQRVYFLCPFCGKRVRKLYQRGEYYRCRECARLNYRSQRATKGTETAAIRMNGILKRDFGITGLAPCDAQIIVPTRPKGMHWKTYIGRLVKLRSAQDDYHREFMKAAAWIIGAGAMDEILSRRK